MSQSCSLSSLFSAVRVVPRGLSRGVRKVVLRKVPNLSRYQDISEVILG